MEIAYFPSISIYLGARVAAKLNTQPSLAMSLHVSFGGFEKLVKGATKPKSTLPKEKYIQPILQAAEGSNTQLQDVFWALQGRLEDPNSIVRA